MHMDISIRKVTEMDAQEVCALSLQLGYKITAAATARAIAEITASAVDDAFVALHNNRVVGWLHVFYTLRMESAPFCEIGGLVVDENARGLGVGKALVSVAKEWGSHRTASLRVRSNVVREAAHAFYLSAGFSEVKSQKVFKMELSPVSAPEK